MTVLFVYLYILFHVIVDVQCHHRKPPVGTKVRGHQDRDVCPAIVCEGQGNIPDECRKPRFIIGNDGETSCKLCDESYCGRKEDVCPRLLCPNDRKIEQFCRKPNYVIGADGITRCRVCDTNACGEHKEVCQPVHCPKADKIKRQCRLKQYMIGRDDVTRCRVCDKDVCRGARTGLQNILVEHHHR